MNELLELWVKYNKWYDEVTYIPPDAKIVFVRIRSIEDFLDWCVKDVRVNEMKDLEQAMTEAVEYLYALPADCPPEIARAIDRLRQLINEEFKPKRAVSSAFIWSVLRPALTKEQE